MVLIGTAGHVDHGKSTLVEALTGINPMHLPEERRRELTIELGFAHLQHPDGYTLGIVDVPGHERLVKTMISGASAFQIALWVVDAREGLMPQSLEHLSVLDLLGVSTIIPVVTKADLASAEQISEAVRSIEQKLRDVSRVHVVDSRSGRGIPELKESIFAACRALGSDRSRASGLPYLSIDRCFVLDGVGTVVTGTLVRGRLGLGDSASISSRPAVYRIRSLHNHHTTVGSIAAGHSAGIHLHGLKAEHVRRGDTLVSPAYPYRSKRLNVQLKLLAGTEFRWKPGLRALFLAAAFEMECRLWGLVRSGEETWVQIELPEEACFYPGQRFILRSTNPLATIGGGTVIDIAPDRLRRVTLAERCPAEYLELSRPMVCELAALARKWMCSEADLRRPHLLAVSGLVWHEKLQSLASSVLAELVTGAKGQEREWSFSAFARLLKIKTEYVGPLLESLLASSAANRTEAIRLTASTLRFDPSYGQLSEGEQRVAVLLLQQLKTSGLQPSRLSEYCAALRADRKAFDKVVTRLVKEDRVVRVDMEFVLDRSVWEAFRDQVRGMPAEGFTASEFGKHFGLSRKYSVPYLECLNRSGALRRQGDRHKVHR